MFEKPEAFREATPVDPYLDVIESAKVAYHERLEKDISESERELLQAALKTCDREAEYFRSVMPRIEAGSTIEDIIAADLQEIQAQKDREGRNQNRYSGDDLPEESILKLAAIAVLNAKEKKG